MPLTIVEKPNNLYDIKISDFTDEELDNFFVEYELIYKNLTKKIYIVFDSWNLQDISYSQILKLSLFLQKMKPIHINHLEEFIILLSNNKILKIIELVFIIVPPVRPYKLKYLKNYSDKDNFSFFD